MSLGIKDLGCGYLERSDGLADATRFYESRDGFSGWVVRSTVDALSYSDPVSNKRDAKALLLTWATDDDEGA